MGFSFPEFDPGEGKQIYSRLGKMLIKCYYKMLVYNLLLAMAFIAAIQQIAICVFIIAMYFDILETI